MLTTIDWEKFHRIFSRYLIMERRLTRGSAAHMDLLRRIRSDMRELVQLVRLLTEEIVRHRALFTLEMARDTVEDLLPCLRVAVAFCGEMRSSGLLEAAVKEMDALVLGIAMLQRAMFDLLRSLEPGGGRVGGICYN